jgi:hypothetical protein
MIRNLQDQVKTKDEAVDLVDWLKFWFKLDTVGEVQAQLIVYAAQVSEQEATISVCPKHRYVKGVTHWL